MSTAIPITRPDAKVEDEPGLLARARDGDPAALEGLVELYLRDVYDLAVRILGDRDLAQDAAQDAFINAIGALRGFRGESSFRTWLLRITANAARSVGRRRSRRRESDLELAASVGSASETPAEYAEHRSEAERLEGALKQLPRKQRLAVSLRTYQGLSFREIGAISECSEGAARVNYHLGIKRLRELVR